MQTARMTSPLSERRCSALFRQQDDVVGPEPDEVVNSASFTPWSRTVRCFASPLQLVPGERVMSGRCWAIDFTL
jgi:hypothetical protein